MKKILILIFFLTTIHFSYGRTKLPPDEWSFDGPGGAYGVLTWNTDGSLVMAGPVEFYSPFGFNTTRILYIGFPLSIILLITVFLIKIIHNKTPNQEASSDSGTPSPEEP